MEMKMTDDNFTDKFDVMLDASAPDFAQRLREAIGLKPGEQVEFITPQFERTDGIVPSHPLFDFDKLPTLSAVTLKAIGCGVWNEPDANGNVLWLYPKEWYALVPDGFTIHSIDGTSEAFKRGETDDDYRFGCLSFGFLRAASRAA
jgi:hypothetical protein